MSYRKGAPAANGWAASPPSPCPSPRLASPSFSTPMATLPYSGELAGQRRRAAITSGRDSGDVTPARTRLFGNSCRKLWKRASRGFARGTYAKEMRMYIVPRMIAIVWVSCIGLFPTPKSVAAAATAGADGTYPQRGRVKIVDNVVVAGNGSLLRGASGNSFEVERYSQFSWWTNLRDDYKLNTVRMFMYCCNPVNTIVNPVNVVNLGRLATNMDIAVNNAKRAGMYLILQIYNRAGYNEAVAQNIWGVIAPRYKDQTHVIYEAFNEPVHWQPSSIDAADIADQEEIFGYIRTRAPRTHIIMWSPAHINDPLIDKVQAGTRIDYSNASVGYHPYAPSTYETAGRLRAAGFPVINTEFSRGKGMQYLSGIWNYHEGNKISWIFLDLNGGSNTETATPNPSHWPKTWPKDPYYQ